MDDRVIPDEVGTSPRMRGKLPRYNSAPCRFRNIPAYAGKTEHVTAAPAIPAEHPRVCGENGVRLPQEGPGGGTSPRMRGKRHPILNLILHFRNIPAYAGKTWWLAGTAAGERGTSPRMRGKRRHREGGIFRFRNIPAYAGKTATRWAPAVMVSEHPRVCGENSVTPSPTPQIAGTSPRMRGKLPGPTRLPQRGRNIPAYAGKTRGCAIRPG